MKLRSKAMLIALMAMLCLLVGCDDSIDDATTSTFTVKEVETLIDSTDYKKSDSSQTAITLASDTTLSDGTKVVDLLNEMAKLQAESTKYVSASEKDDVKYDNKWNNAVFTDLEVTIDGKSQGKATITLNGEITDGVGDVTMNIAQNSTISNLMAVTDVTYVFTWNNESETPSIKKQGSSPLGDGNLKTNLIALWNKAEEQRKTTSGTVVETTSNLKYAYKVNGDGFTQWVLSIPTTYTISSEGTVSQSTLHFFMEYKGHHICINGTGSFDSNSTTVVLDNVEYANVIPYNAMGISSSPTSFYTLMMDKFYANMPMN